jgi:hypothetical protein
MAPVGTWMDSEVAASFAAELGVPTLAMETWTAGSQTGGHWDIAAHRNLRSTAQEHSSSQRDWSSKLITAC